MSEIQTVNVTFRADGCEVASGHWNGQDFQAVTRTGAIMAVCRAMRFAGRPDCAWQSVDCVTGVVGLYGNSLHNISKFTISETDRGMRFVKWAPHPLHVRLDEIAA